MSESVYRENPLFQSSETSVQINPSRKKWLLIPVPIGARFSRMEATGRMPNGRLGSEQHSVLLTVSSDLNDIRTLQAFLDEWTVRGVQTCADALGALRRSSCSIVLCEKELPDGCWQDLLSGMRELQQGTPLIVMSRLADETLWADVLREGGFDVLAKPLEKSEVSRVFSGAARWSSRGKAFAQAS